MWSLRFAAALMVFLLPNPLSACEIAIRDAKGAIERIAKKFEAQKIGCQFEDQGIQCHAKEPSLRIDARYIPDYFASLNYNAYSKSDKDDLAALFLDHLIDRSPKNDIRSRFIHALEGGAPFKFNGDGCAIAARLTEGTIEVVLAGPTVR